MDSIQETVKLETDIGMSVDCFGTFVVDLRVQVIFRIFSDTLENVRDILGFTRGLRKYQLGSYRIYLKDSHWTNQSRAISKFEECPIN